MWVQFLVVKKHKAICGTLSRIFVKLAELFENPVCLYGIVPPPSALPTIVPLKYQVKVLANIRAEVAVSWLG